MYACICSAVTVDEVNDAIDSGAVTVDQVGERTCAGDNCGSCHPTLQDLIARRCGACPIASPTRALSVA